MRIRNQAAGDPRMAQYLQLEGLMAGITPIDTQGLVLTRIFESEADRLETAMLNNIKMRFVDTYVKRYVKCQFPKSLRAAVIRHVL
jgi:hypothetical protein